MRRFWPWLRVLLGAAVLALLVRALGAEPFVRGVAMIDAPALLAALGIGAVTTVAAARRWVIVARGVGLRLGLGRAVGDYYRAQLLNAVLPAGVLGDVHRAFAHGRRSAVANRTGAAGRAVRAVVLERAAGQVVLVSAALIAVGARTELVAVAARALPTDVGALAAGAAVLVAASAAALWLLRSRRGHRIRSRTLAWAAEARTALLARGRWAAVAGLSAAALAGHLTLFAVAARVAGTDAPAVILLPPLLLALLAMSVPVGVGGWGPRESAAALGFAAVGIGAEAGLRTAVVYGVLTLVAALPGVLMLLPRPKPRRGRLGVRKAGQGLEPANPSRETAAGTSIAAVATAPTPVEATAARRASAGAGERARPGGSGS